MNLLSKGVDKLGFINGSRGKGNFFFLGFGGCLRQALRVFREEWPRRATRKVEPASRKINHYWARLAVRAFPSNPPRSFAPPSQPANSQRLRLIIYWAPPKQLH